MLAVKMLLAMELALNWMKHVEAQLVQMHIVLMAINSAKSNSKNYFI